MASKSRKIGIGHAHKRSKNGCLPCRRRRKKCDEAKPTCIGCLRNHLICAWPDGQHGIDKRSTFGPKVMDSKTCTVMPNEERKDLATNEIALFLTQWRSPSTTPPSLRERQRAKLLDHYVSRTAPRLASKYHPENPFMTYNLRVAWLSETMQHALLALSSADLLDRQPNMVETSRAHYAVALRSIKYGLTAWTSMTSTHRLSLLASTLTLCWFEVR